MEKDKLIFIAGKDGVAGSAIVRCLKEMGYQHLLLPSHKELDYSNQNDVNRYFKEKKPAYVFYAAAKMGSIVYRNEHPADIMYENMIMQMNVLRAAHENGVKKLLFMGSDFIYPRMSCNVLHEEDFLTAGLDEKDLPYTLAKIAGVKLCDYYHQQFGDEFFSVIPCAFFGINSSFDVERANVVASLIKRLHTAKVREEKEFVLWGSGKPVKEFLFSDDVANACIFLMQQDQYFPMINIGSGDGGTSIWELAQIIRRIVGFSGEIVCDRTKPDGIMYRVMDSTKLHDCGWRARYPLEEAIELTYRHFLEMYGYKL